MRIHDINLVADLTAHDPNDPYPCDGTIDGGYPNISDLPLANSFLTLADSAIQGLLAWWEDIWPRLQLFLEFTTPNGGWAIVHYSIDLLGDLQVEETDFTSPQLQQMSLAEKELWIASIGEEVTSSGEAENQVMFLSEVAIGVIGICCSLLPSAFSAGGLPAVAMVLEIAVGTWILWIASLLRVFELQFVSLNFIVGVLAIWLDSLISPVGLVLNLVLKPLLLFYIINYAVTSTKSIQDWKDWFIWTIIGAIAQFFMWAYTYFLFIMLLEMTLSSYGG